MLVSSISRFDDVGSNPTRIPPLPFVLNTLMREIERQEQEQEFEQN